MTDAPPTPGSIELTAARVKALSSPLRWRIIRLCLHQSRTNKELAELLGVNPGSMLHHVRTLVANGYLVPEEPRRGARNAKEIPYRATQLSWYTGDGVPHVETIMLDLLLQEIQGIDESSMEVWRLGMMLSPDQVAALKRRILALLTEYRDAASADPPPPDAVPWSLMAFLHPDNQQGAP